MGLDVTHDCWHGAYSAFGRWRAKLAELGGYELDAWQLRHPHGAELWEKPEWRHLVKEPPPEKTRGLIFWDNITTDNLQGDWEMMPEDPLIILLAHSDCDGKITADHAGPLAVRLEKLIPLMGEEDGGGHIGSYAEKTTQFVKGLREAAAAGEAVEFR